MTDETRETPGVAVTASPAGPSYLKTLFDYIELIALVFAAVLFVTVFIFRIAIVDGSSMEKTFSDGEVLVMSDLFYTPESGDIVVFDNIRDAGYSKALIKRVIGAAGDRIVIRRDGVFRNGEKMDEPYVFTSGGFTNDYITYARAFGCTVLTDDDGPFCVYDVPEGYVFVMGDNRFNSHDGRAIGPIPEEYVLGHVFLRVSPLSRFGGVG